MTRKDIIEEYNRKAKEYNKTVMTDQQRELNHNYGTSKSPDESTEQFRQRMVACWKTLMILPNPDIE